MHGAGGQPSRPREFAPLDMSDAAHQSDTKPKVARDEIAPPAPKPASSREDSAISAKDTSRAKSPEKTVPLAEASRSKSPEKTVPIAAQTIQAPQATPEKVCLH